MRFSLICVFQRRATAARAPALDDRQPVEERPGQLLGHVGVGRHIRATGCATTSQRRGDAPASISAVVERQHARPLQQARQQAQRVAQRRARRRTVGVDEARQLDARGHVAERPAGGDDRHRAAPLQRRATAPRSSPRSRRCARPRRPASAGRPTPAARSRAPRRSAPSAGRRRSPAPGPPRPPSRPCPAPPRPSPRDARRPAAARGSAPSRRAAARRTRRRGRACPPGRGARWPPRPRGSSIVCELMLARSCSPRTSDEPSARIASRSSALRRLGVDADQRLGAAEADQQPRAVVEPELEAVVGRQRVGPDHRMAGDRGRRLLDELDQQSVLERRIDRLGRRGRRCAGRTTARRSRGGAPRPSRPASGRLRARG